MKITLIYPPSLRQHDECFLMPQLSVPTLARCLRQAGHEVKMVDYNVFFHKLRATARYSRIDFGVLKEKDKTLKYIKHNEHVEVFGEIEKAFFDWQAIGESELYGISLMSLDMYSNKTGLQEKNLFVFNSAALIANWIKKRFSGTVAIGSDDCPKPAYHAILSRYPCFDFAIYGSGEASILKLTGHLVDKTVRLSHMLEKTAAGVIDHLGVVEPASKGSADYKGYPLEMYSVPAEAMLERYYYGVKKFLDKKRAASQLVIPYQFDNSCRGKCAFCPSGDLALRSANTVDQTFEDLCRLKERGVTGIYFINTNFNNTYKFADNLCDKMIKAKLNLLWCDCANFREIDEKLLLKMKKAGAIKLTFGFETGSPRLLRFIRKGITTDSIEKYLRYSHSLGIWNAIELIAGLPSETSADVRETLAFLKKLAVTTDSFALGRFRLFVQPPFGSPFGQKPSEFGIRLLEDDLKDYSFITSGAMRFFTRKFDEINGPAWGGKEKLLYDSEKAIGELVRSNGCVYDKPQHMYLLMFLYRTFGYSNKKLIKMLFHYATREYRPYHSSSAISASAV